MALTRRNKRNNEDQEIESNDNNDQRHEYKKMFLSMYHIPKYYMFSLVFASLLIIIFLLSQWNKKNITITSAPYHHPVVSINKRKKYEKETTLILPTTTSTETQSPSPLYFIMYVGPPKTGSTSIQCSLRYLQDENILPNNIYVMKKSFHIDGCGKLKFKTKKNDDGPITNFMRECLRRWDYNSSSNNMPDCWNTKYMSYIKKQMKLNKNILIIEETLSWFPEFILLDHNKRKSNSSSKNEKEMMLLRAQKFLSDFVESLNDERYKLMIIVSYRNYIDWIFSYYTQKSKRLIHKKNIFLLDDHKKGQYIVPPEIYIKSNPVLRNHYSDYVYDFFAMGINSSSTNNNNNATNLNSSRVSLHLLNMENTTNILHDFFCNIVPSSLNLCQYVNITSKLDTSNTSPNYLFCDILVTQAYQNGFFKKYNITATSNSRYQIYSNIRNYIENEKGLSCNEALVNYTICPSNESYDKLFQTSMKLHYKIFPDDDHSIEVEYREKFERTKYKFCTPNSTAVFEDEGWRSFFASYMTQKE